MSFLNPVNEPVLRFKSTDAGAPQINYNARVAGDVKAVLKACLVAGYGSTASAGWAIVNEVGHAAEFVSPSAAMSDYRLGVDDTSTSNTIWHYYFQDAKTTPRNSSVSKSFTSINKTHPQNGWQLLVTERGMCFVEHVFIAAVDDLVARVTYIGQVKCSIHPDPALNMGFWVVGIGATALVNFFSGNNYSGKDYALASIPKDDIMFTGANIPMLSRLSSVINESNTAITAGLYIHAKGQLIAQQPAILMQDNIAGVLPYGVKDIVFDGRPNLYACLGADSTNIYIVYPASRGMLIATDYWEY